MRALSWVAVAATATTLVIAFLRLYIGTDFLDESYYVSVGYRSSLGDRLFVDERNLTQSFVLITGPLIRFYHLVTGGTDGLVLYTRRLYLLMNCLAAATVFGALRKKIPWPAALAISTLCIAFLPFNVPNLSYNTLGCALFTMGVFLGMGAVFDRATPPRLVSSGIAHGLAIVAYTSMIVPVAVFAGCLLGMLAKPRIRAIGWYCAAGLGVGLLALIAAGSDGVTHAYEFMRERRGGDALPISGVLGSIAWGGPSKLVLIAILGLAVALRRQRPVGAAVGMTLVSLLPLLYLHALWNEPLWRSGLFFVASWATLAPLLLPLLWQTRYLRQLLLGAWIPSLVGGVVLSLTSSNGYLNAGLALVPAAIVSSVLIFEWARRSTSQIESETGSEIKSETRAVGFASLIAVLLVSAVLLSFQRGMYLSGTVMDRREQVDWGPFRGLYGAPGKDAYLSNLWRHVEPLVNDEGRILFYDHFPAGYLLTTMKPATPSMYTCYVRFRERNEHFCSDFYLEHLHPRNVVVQVPSARITGLHSRYSPASDVRLDRIVRRSHRLVAEQHDKRRRPLFRVYSGPPVEE